MNTDQDLIFEAYAKTLNEGSHFYGRTATTLTCWERLEELWRDEPELEGVLLPILLDIEDACVNINKLDPNGMKGTVPTQALFDQLNQIYPF